MIDLSEFEFDKVPVQEGRFVLPAGEYVAAVIESEQRQTNSGDGSYVRLTFEVLAGEHKGRRIWENFNLWNNNQDAVRIAKERMARLMRAAGHEKLTSADQLCGVPVVIVVKVGSHYKTNEATSEIKGYKSAAKAPAVAPKAQKPDEEKEEGEGVPW